MLKRMRKLNQNFYRNRAAVVDVKLMAILKTANGFSLGWNCSAVLGPTRLTGRTLHHRPLSPQFASRRQHIWRVFHLWLHFITRRYRWPIQAPMCTKVAVKHQSSSSSIEWSIKSVQPTWHEIVEFVQGASVVQLIVRLITVCYHLSSNLGVGISDGWFIFDFPPLPLEVVRPN